MTVNTGPGNPQNPKWILADASALFQLIVAEEIRVLHHLKTAYQVQTLVVEAVEAEIAHLVQRRDPQRAQKVAAWKKALNNGTVRLLNERLLIELKGASAGPPLMRAINDLGSKFYERVDRGEAFTHAAANALEAPTLSNDVSAVRQLRRYGIRLPLPVLRSFDVLVFGFQSGLISDVDCADARKRLLRADEAVEQCFANCSFTDGLHNFYLRLMDASAPIIGAPDPIDRSLDVRLHIRKLTPATQQAFNF